MIGFSRTSMLEASQQSAGSYRRTFVMLCCVLGLAVTCTVNRAGAEEPVRAVQQAGITGGVVVQVGRDVGFDPLALRVLGESFHVRILLPDDDSVRETQGAIDNAGLAGRFTVGFYEGGLLPFAERVVNALVLSDPASVARDEAMRVLAPRGLLVTPDGVIARDVPGSIDEWTHYLYDASGNALSRDAEVASPRYFRWYAPPLHLRSHNWSASFLGLVTSGGRLFYVLDEGSPTMQEGGIQEHWTLVARDAFNGALLWKKPLEGYGQPFFEPVGMQPTSDNVWRSPVSINRRVVADGDRVYASLSYRQGPLSILDAGTGEVIHEVELGGSVDEVIAEEGVVVCWVRTEIPMPSDEFTLTWARRKKMEAEGVPPGEVGKEFQARYMAMLMKQPLERVVAVDAATGEIRWTQDAPLVAHQGLAMAEGKVVFHNYADLVALDVRSGKELWRFNCPVVDRHAFQANARGMLGALLIAEGKVLWMSRATGGGYCLSLETGEQIWHDKGMDAPGGFGFPTGVRVIDGTIWWDSPRGVSLETGQRISAPDLGGMMKRGHHTRCFPGKATTRFLIAAQRGAEFIDLQGDEHMVNDWIRGTCSMGNLPANGLFYVTPDPCACYAGAKINGFHALSAREPAGMDTALAPDAAIRLRRGPAFDEAQGEDATLRGWPTYRADARRTGRAGDAVPARLAPAWRAEIGGRLTQPTVSEGRLYVVQRDTYQLLCLRADSGEEMWRRSFPGTLDGPPTVVGPRLFIGCGDGRVYCLRAADGQLAWSFLAAPLDRLSISDDRLASVWPVHSSVLYQDGLIYAMAGRNSFLDGGLRLYALDPADGTVRHHVQVDGPWPTPEQLRTPVVTEGELKKDSSLLPAIQSQYATGYDMEGVEGDLLVSDGRDLYMSKTKFTPQLEQVKLQRESYIGLRPMGGRHVMPQFGFMDDSMYHRTYWLFDDFWTAKAGGNGTAARAGSILVVGEEQVYAARHWVGGWYPKHLPGSGNRITSDPFDTANMRGDQVPNDVKKKLGFYGNSSDLMRTAPPTWEAQVTVLIRAMLVAPDGQGGELVYSAGVVEGTSVAEWNESAFWRGDAKLLVHAGMDGSPQSEMGLPACPVFDGMASAGGKLYISLSNGELMCLDAAP